MRLSVLVPSMRNANGSRTLTVFMACLLDNTTEEFEFLLSSHNAKDAYVALNDLAAQASGEYLVMLGDDMYVAPHWNEALIAGDPSRLEVGSLTESGLSPVNEENWKRDFGVTPEEYRRAEFEQYAATLRPFPEESAQRFWGLPWCINRKTFLDRGGFDIHNPSPAIRDALDFYFWRAWLDEGLRVRRAPMMVYHLMRWTSRDYQFGKRKERP